MYVVMERLYMKVNWEQRVVFELAALSAAGERCRSL